MAYNQIVIEKVNNGYIGTLQGKSSVGLLGMSKQVDKEHFVFTDPKELAKWVSMQSKLLDNTQVKEEIVEEDENEIY